MLDSFARVMMMPSEVVARRQLRVLLRRPIRVIRQAPINVHRLRVSIRQAEAALRLFAPCLRPGVTRELEACFSRSRRLAGRVRDADVHLAILAELGRASCEPAIVGWSLLREIAERDRREALNDLASRAGGSAGKALRRARREVLDGIVIPDGAASSWGALTLAALRPTVEAVRAALPRGADVPEDRLHELRLAIKRARYALVILHDELTVDSTRGAIASLETAQGWLGGVADAASLHARATKAAQQDGRLLDVRERLGRWREHRRLECLGWLLREGNVEILGSIAGVVSELAGARRHAEEAGSAPDSNVSVAAWAQRPPRVGVVDLGSNSIRLLVGEGSASGARVIEEVREPVRLGEGLERDGALSTRAIERASEAASGLCDRAASWNVSVIRMVATAAARGAPNQDQLVTAIASRTGRALEIIGGVEEGRLAFVGATSQCDPGLGGSAVVDVGGGSTEIVLACRGVPCRIASMPVGAIGLTERFEEGTPRAGKEAWSRMRGEVEARLRELRLGVAWPIERLIATGGSAAALGVLAGCGPGEAVGIESLRGFARTIRAMDPARRSSIPGLTPDRGVVVLAGLAILLEVMRALEVSEVRVTTAGVRHGVANELVLGSGEFLDEARRLALGCGWNPRRGERESVFAGVIAGGLEAGDARSAVVASAASMLRTAGQVAWWRGVARRSREIVESSRLVARWPGEAGMVARVIGSARDGAGVDRLHACVGLGRRLAAIRGVEGVRVGEGADQRPVVIATIAARGAGSECESCARWARRRLGVGVAVELAPERVTRHAARALRAGSRPLPSGR